MNFHVEENFLMTRPGLKLLAHGSKFKTSLTTKSKTCLLNLQWGLFNFSNENGGSLERGQGEGNGEVGAKNRSPFLGIT